MQKPSYSFNRLIAALALATTFAGAAQAAQVVTPRHVSGGGVAANTDISATAVTVGAGGTLTFDVQYSVTGTQTANESGLGLKVRYDANLFNNVNVTPISAAGGNFTNVASMLTKCAIAGPSDQVGTYSIAGFTTPREVIFGWIDTSVRAAGAVGWPGTADPASPNGCLNPGFTTSTAGVTPATNLFRISLTTKPGFSSGSTTIRLTADGNISYANTTPLVDDKNITVNGAAAPAISMTGAATRRNHGISAGDRDISVATAFGSDLPANTITAAANAALSGDTSITVESRRGTGASLNDFAAIMSFNTAATSGTATVVSCTVWNGSAGVACPVTPTVGAVSFPGGAALVPLAGVPDQSRVRVRLANVNGSGINAEVTLGFLVGDVQNDRAVNTGDINQVKAQSGSTVTSVSTNIRFDVNGDGNINTGDINAVKAASGRRLP